MSERNPKDWTRARLARDKLETEFIRHPDVSLIDIGDASPDGVPSGKLAVRIHVRDRWMQATPEDRVAFPDDVDGIPVIVLPGDYDLSAS